jgi:hypothetical protein
MPVMMDSVHNFSHDWLIVILVCLEMNAADINSFLTEKDTGTPSKMSSHLMFSG